MNLPVNFLNESELRAAFSYLTRIGAAPHFGSMPIAYYQQQQCAAISILEQTGADKVRYRAGSIELFQRGKWRRFCSANELYNAAYLASYTKGAA